MDGKEKNVIALDGPAGSGKSSVARVLAERLGFVHADSGAIYRLATLALMEKIGPGENPEGFGVALAREEIDFSELACEVVLEDSRQSNRIRGRDAGDEIRTPEVTSRIRFIADNPRYREAVNGLLRSFSRHTDLVADGRDIGTEVFPNAAAKFFLTASSRVRAERRLGEFIEKGMLSAEQAQEKLPQLEEEIKRRDAEDEARPIGALRRAPDAILIDTSNMDLNAVVSALLSYSQIQF